MAHNKRSTKTATSSSRFPSPRFQAPEVTFDPPRITGDFSVSPLVLPPAPVAEAELELERILFGRDD